MSANGPRLPVILEQTVNSATLSNKNVTYILDNWRKLRLI